MASTRVVKFPRSDDASSFILVQITPKGSKPLDVKLVGTEGEEPYVASLKQDRISSLKVKNSPASDAEWETILESLLNQEPLPDIQATALVQSESSLSITIRKQIQGITQRLGTITLKHDPNEAIELFEWCGTAVEASAAGKESLTNSGGKLKDAEAAVKDLQSQLEELIQAKEEDETALLQKFRDLLNEKKVKIREQQQLLASGSFNASRPGSSQPTSQIPSPSAQQQSRGSKRKMPASKRVDEDSTSGEAQEMDVDVKEEPEDSDPGNTTEATASATDDDDDDDDGDGDGDGDEESAHLMPASASAEPASERRSARQGAPKKAAEKPPPPRELPFNKKKPTRAAPPPTGNETDSDDEL